MDSEKALNLLEKERKSSKKVLINDDICYPLYLPMDRDFEAKYMDRYLNKHSKQGKKTKQEKVYMFLEHPNGWCGFLYHMSV